LADLVELEKKSAEYKDVVSQTKAAVKEIETALKTHRQQLSAWNKEINSKVSFLVYNSTLII